MTNLLEVKDLTICFNENKFDAVSDVSFNIPEGKIVGLVGESGSGKSVTALSILGLLDRKKVTFGAKSSIKFNDQQIVNASEKEMMKLRGGEIGFIFQEPMSSLNPLHRIGHQIAETLVVHQGMTYKKALKEATNLLKLTGIRNPKQRAKAFPFELSGGQRQRVMIAMAIANNPKLLIADEPTTALDVTIQAQIIDLLLDLRNKTGMAILFISHDLNLVRKIADYVCVMKNGKIVEQGSTKDVFLHPKHSYTKTLICPFIGLKNDNNDKYNEVVLSASKLNVVFPLKKNFWGKIIQDIYAVDGVSLDLYKGECLGIVGESGSGKTTLGMAACGLVPHGGTVCLDGIDIKQLNAAKVRKSIQVVFQDPYNSLNPRMNIEQIVGEGVDVHFPEISEVQRLNKIIAALQDVGLSKNDLYKYPHEFSGGQRQRIAIARALVVEPKILVLDEPTSALDVTIQAQVIKLLLRLKAKYNLSYIFISHDMNVIKSVADKVAVMKDGKIIEAGFTGEIFSNPQTDYAKELIATAL